MIDRKIPPAASRVEFIKNIEPAHFRLSNNIPVYMIDEGLQEVLRIELVYKAGNLYQKMKQVARATNTLIPTGTSSRTAEEISEHFDFYGAYLETKNGKDNAYIGLYTLNKHLENTLPMLAEILMDSTFPEHELDLFRSTRKQHLNINLQKVKYLARVYFNEQVFGKEHPYGMRLQDTHLDALERELLVQHYRHFYNAQNCMIVVSGKIPAGLEALLEKYLGSMNSKRVKIPEVGNTAIISSDMKKQTITKNGSLQVALRIGKPMINRLHPDYPALFVVNTILGGYFGSRLMHNIREDKGYTYGIGSVLASMQHSGLFVISSEVGSKVLDAAFDEIFKEIKKLREEPVGEEELLLVKNYLMGALMRSLDGPFAVAERLRSALEFGQTMDYYMNYAATIQNIRPRRVQELANNYFEADTFFETIAGNI